MSKHINLLEGNIFASLTKLALPIMGTSLIQMAYNMIDMIWIGRVGSNAVAAVGAAGMFMWMSETLVMLGRMGGQVKVGQLLGAKKPREAAQYAQNAFQMSLGLAFVYTILMMVATGPLIGFFRLNNPQTVADAQTYLRLVSLGTICSFANQLFTGLITATGNSRTPFLATTAGLILNIVLDPVLIFTFHMGVAGAAVATVIAQLLVTILFLLYALKDSVLFSQVRLFRRPNFSVWGEIAKIGLPPAVQTLMFSGISMVIARLIAGFGDAAVAVQKVGSQIESISWMTADGFGAAVNSFVAQNYGSGNLHRAKKGYQSALGLMMIWGVFSSCLLLFLPGPVFQIFIQDPQVLPMGIEYLSILGFSQLFMCMESVTGGAFSGMGKTFPPSLVSVTFTAARIPLAMLLGSTALGLCGVWWSISISSILKGVIITVWFCFFLRRVMRTKAVAPV